MSNQITIRSLSPADVAAFFRPIFEGDEANSPSVAGLPIAALELLTGKTSRELRRLTESQRARLFAAARPLNPHFFECLDGLTRFVDEALPVLEAFARREKDLGKQ